MAQDNPKQLSVEDQIEALGLKGHNADVFRGLSEHDRNALPGLLLGVAVIKSDTKDVAKGLVDADSGEAAIVVQD